MCCIHAVRVVFDANSEPSAWLVCMPFFITGIERRGGVNRDARLEAASRRVDRIVLVPRRSFS